MRINIKKDSTQKGIWQYSQYLTDVPSVFRLSLNEGNTSEEFFAHLDVILKREDQNPTGSLKDRGMAFLISKALSEGFNNFVLSSSGNAAISSANYCKKAELKLKIFVSPKIDKNKMLVLKQMRADVSTDNRPLTMAARFSKENNAYNLRPSLNKFGGEGYQTISFELTDGNQEISDIFIPVSSGVNLLGIYQGFKKTKMLPRLHLCQSSAVCPLACLFDRDYPPEEVSLATALVAKHSPLKQQILKAIEESGGTGWVIGNEQIRQADKILRGHKIETSAEGALALAAVEKARKKGWQIKKGVCLLTGKKY